GHLSNDLIMYVQHDRMAGGFDPQHCISKQITSYSADDVFSPQAAVSALSVPAILKLSGSIIGKHDVLFAFVTDDARLGIAKYASARQDQLKECAIALEPNDTTTNDTATFLHSSPCCFIQSIPELLDVGMRLAPSTDKCLDLIITEPIRLKLTPSA